MGEPRNDWTERCKWPSHETTMWIVFSFGIHLLNRTARVFIFVSIEYGTVFMMQPQAVSCWYPMDVLLEPLPAKLGADLIWQISYVHYIHVPTYIKHMFTYIYIYLHIYFFKYGYVIFKKNKTCIDRQSG